MDKHAAQHPNLYFRKFLRRFVIGFVLLLTTIITGIIGFMVISDYTFMEAYYMTIITLASVGYNEVKPLDEAGKLFTTILILFNMGIFAYAITSLSAFLVEGDLHNFLKHRQVNKQLEQLKGHTIICGYGRHGSNIAQELHRNHVHFVVIEPNAHRVESLEESGFLFLEGDATNDSILHRAGIERAQSIVITFGEDAFNVYAVLTARQINPHIRIISRASDEHAEHKLKRAGANYVVRSEHIGGFYMATLIQQPQMVEFFHLISNMSNVSIHFKEVRYETLKEEYRDKSLRELSFRMQTGINVIGLRRADGHYIINPSPDENIYKGMSLIVLGDQAQMRSFEEWALEA